MTPSIILLETAKAGVVVTLSADDPHQLKVNGDRSAVERWLPAIKANKAAIIETLKMRSIPLTVEHETTIRAWLAHIEETDPTIITKVLDRCRTEPETRAYFLWRAAEVPQPAHDDNRITCGQCANLTGRRCQAARRSEIEAGRSYEPVRDLLRRCEGYAPDGGAPIDDMAENAGRD